MITNNITVGKNLSSSPDPEIFSIQILMLIKNHHLPKNLYHYHQKSPVTLI